MTNVVRQCGRLQQPHGTKMQTATDTYRGNTIGMARHFGSHSNLSRASNANNRANKICIYPLLWLKLVFLFLRHIIQLIYCIYYICICGPECKNDTRALPKFCSFVPLGSAFMYTWTLD